MSVRDAAHDVNAFPPKDGDNIASEPYVSAAQALAAASLAVGDRVVDEIALTHRGPGAPRVTVKCRGRDAEALQFQFAAKASAIEFYKLAWHKLGSLA